MTTDHYYNEFDPNAAQWIRNLIHKGLIPGGDVDERSITEVKGDDVRRYRQCHWFCGISGWPLALRIAGVAPTEHVWSGSCPCQPFSVAGKGKGEEDVRHLWPELFRLIAECQPARVFGEQVAGKAGLNWLAGVRLDVEGVGYRLGAADLCAPGAGQEAEGRISHGGTHVSGRIVMGHPHIRQRLYWVADANHRRRGVLGVISDPTQTDEGSTSSEGRHGFNGEPLHCGATGGLEYAPSDGRDQRRTESNGRGIAGGCHVSGLPDASDGRRELPYRGHGDAPPWLTALPILCRDGKYRRVPAQSEVLGDVDGVSAVLGRLCPDRYPLSAKTKGRAVRLKGYGNAIVPPLAAEFVKAYYEAIKGES